MAGTATSGTITQWFKREFAKDLKPEDAIEELSKIAGKVQLVQKI